MNVAFLEGVLYNYRTYCISYDSSKIFVFSIFFVFVASEFFKL